MAKQTVFVIGASGKIGSATLKVLSAKYTDKIDIIAGSRNPDTADHLKLPGVKLVKATMGDKESLKDTLKGVDALYIVTPPGTNRPQLVLETAEAAKEAGVQFLLIISGSSACYPHTTVGGQFNEIETRIPQLGVPYCFLRLPMFLDGILGHVKTIRSQSAFYSFTTKPFTSVVVEDAGKVSAAILSDYTRHGNKCYVPVSDCYSNSDLASAFTEILGKEIKFIQRTHEETKQAIMAMGVSEKRAESLMELGTLEGAPEFSITDTSLVRTLTGEEPTSLKAFIAKNAETFQV